MKNKQAEKPSKNIIHVLRDKKTEQLNAFKKEKRPTNNTRLKIRLILNQIKSPLHHKEPKNENTINESTNQRINE